MRDLFDVSRQLLRAPPHLVDEHTDEVGIPTPRAQEQNGHLAHLLARRAAFLLDLVYARRHLRPRVPEDRLEHFFLRPEVVVDEAVRDARLLGDLADPARVVALARERRTAASTIWRRFSS